MNRRTALMVSMFLAGLVPRGLWAQSAGRKSSKHATRHSQPVSSRDDPTSDLPPATTSPRSVRPRARLPVAPLPDHALHQGRQQPGQSAEGHDRLDLQAHRHRRVARRQDRRPLGQPDRAARLQFARSPQAGRRGRRAIHQRDRGHAVGPRAVHRGRRHPLAILGLLAAHVRRQRPARAADLDDAAGRRRLGPLADAGPAGVPEAGRPAGRDDQRPDPHDQDGRAAPSPAGCSATAARGRASSPRPTSSRRASSSS